MIRSRRTKPRRTSVVILHGEEFAKFRQDIWERDHHCCVWCNRWVPLEADDDFKKMDLMHLRKRKRYGDIASNCVTSCHECHQNSHNCDGKPVPSKGVSCQ